MFGGRQLDVKVWTQVREVWESLTYRWDRDEYTQGGWREREEEKEMVELRS